MNKANQNSIMRSVHSMSEGWGIYDDRTMTHYRNTVYY